mmetsp:Transcript_28555/g.58363  ORF Transcript_28555/g.58363 Transcript_28555/m.58363 type:complete len:377 (+) Transcript_28555:52-1182(+)|eukprot:CAMPEP_0181294568 /NCGR_PEP_ID=MMETSP1101-20121128/3675_1 /TAXON_ID=46948 /ORGANISM="Rhodomonas abbreviata, Strain Caron Lab Isolate" /LENGTH=376 /DNA_ID=CAMNT_0023399245 /DNA_START=49 /DNA_END=1179 /DNA_ORIENTATION=+
MVSKLFVGLNAPAPYLKVDTLPLDTFLAKLLDAVKSTDMELQALKDENATLKKDVAALKNQAKNSESESLRADIAILKEKVVVLEGKLYNMESKVQSKAESSALKEVKETAESASRCVTELQTDMTTFKGDLSKHVKETKSQLSGLQNQLTEQINVLTDTKADKKDMYDLRTKIDNAVRQCDQNTEDMEALKAVIKDFMSKVEAAIAGKADVDALNEKMGRMEVDDLLNQLNSSLDERLRRVNKDLQELREDLDVILTMIMQDANVGAGMLKCLSCEKPVALHRPGPPPGSGREPVILQGTDKNMYRANKDVPDAGRCYSPRWASSNTPDKQGRSTASPPRRSSIGGGATPDKPREKTPSKKVTRPSSAKVRSSVA